MPVISVIVPVYNVENYLHRCIDSILAQTFTDFELILVDDGSTDQSGAICDEYAKLDARVRVIHKENGGVSSSRNIGLDHAQGMYVMFCDSDDYVMNSWVEKLAGIMCHEDVDIAICKYGRVCRWEDVEHRVRYDRTDAYEVLFRNEFYRICKSGLSASVCNKIFKNSIISETHLRFDTQISNAEDILFTLEYMQYSSKKIGLIESCEYCYFDANSDSLSHKYIPHCWAVSEKYIRQTFLTLEACGVDIPSIEKDLNSGLVHSILMAINNLLSPMNKEGFLKKNTEGQRIINSDECKKILKNCDFVDIHPLYRMALKSRCFLLVWLFFKAVDIKNKIAH